MAHQGIPIYVLGRTLKETRRASSAIAGNIGYASEDLNDVWIIHKHVKLNEGFDIRIKDAEISSDIHLQSKPNTNELLGRESSNPQAESHHMEYLKSIPESTKGPLNDNGYESEDSMDIQTPEVHDHIETHIHEIALTTNPASELASLTLYRFIRPGIFILAVETECLEQNMDLFERTLKELGTYKVLTKAEYTQLIVVDISMHTRQNKNGGNLSKCPVVRKLFNKIRKSYLGDHFDVCDVNNLAQKIRQIVLECERRGIWPSSEYAKQHSLNNLLKQDNLFMERKVIEKSYDLSALEESEMFCFEMSGKDYICCRPDKLVKTFVDILAGMKRKGNLSDCVSVDSFTEDIDFFREVNMYLRAFTAAGLVLEEGDALIHVLPLTVPGLLPQFDEERELSVETNVLRLEIDTDVIPVNIMLAIIMSLVHRGWSVKTAAPKACASKQSVMLEKGSFGLIIAFEEMKSYIGLCVVRFQTEASNSDTIDCTDCEEIRVAVEKGIEISETKQSIHICGRSIRMKDEKDVLKMDATNWNNVTPILNNVGQSHGASVVELLSHWYSSKSREIEETLNKDMSDDILIKVAHLFGKGYQGFFIGQKIPSAVVERIEEETPRDVVKTVFQLLKEWKRMYGFRANLSNLKAAIRGSNINVDLTEFENIAKDVK